MAISGTKLMTRTWIINDLTKSKLYSTFLLCLSTFLLFADQNLIAPNLSQIATEFGFNEIEKDEKLGGEIAMGFFMIGGLASVVVGILADNINRCHLYAFIICIGELSCLGIVHVRTYNQFYYCRVLTGVSIGGASPIIFSLLADFFPSSARIYASTLVGFAMAGGVTCGQLFASLTTWRLGWRGPFVVIAIPALLCALLISSTLSEPVRGGQDDVIAGEILSTDHISPSRCRDKRNHHVYAEKFEFHKIVKLLRRPTILLALLQGVPGCIPWGIISTFLNDYLIRDGNFTSTQSTEVVTTFFIGAFVGSVFGGWLGQKVYNVDVRYQAPLMGASTCAGTFPLLFILNANGSSMSNANNINIIDSVDSNIAPAAVLTALSSSSSSSSSAQASHFPLLLAVAMLGGILSAMTGPNIRSVLQNVTPPELRGTAFAIFTLTDDIGKGGGPAAVAWLTRHVGSRRRAFTLGVCAWLVCGLLLACTGCTVVGDQAAVVLHIRSSKKRSSSEEDDDGVGFVVDGGDHGSGGPAVHA